MPTHRPAAAKKTAAKKRLRKNEPLLNAMARKIGYVAGTLTHAAQGLAGALPAKRSVPEHSSAKRPKGSAPKTKNLTHRKESVAAAVGASKTRTRTLRKKAGPSGVARSPRKRAAKS